jgi:hypothetical protein
LCEKQPEFLARGAILIGVGGAADYQAAALQPDYPARLLLDPEGRLRGALGLDAKLSVAQMLGWQSGKRYVRSLMSTRPGRISRVHAVDCPAVVVLDADLRLVWGHEGKSLGDYPDVATVMAAVG